MACHGDGLLLRPEQHDKAAWLGMLLCLPQLLGASRAEVLTHPGGQVHFCPGCCSQPSVYHGPLPSRLDAITCSNGCVMPACSCHHLWCLHLTLQPCAADCGGHIPGGHLHGHRHQGHAGCGRRLRPQKGPADDDGVQQGERQDGGCPG